MKPVSPVIPSRPSLPEQVIAENQKDYLPLPAIVGQDGVVLTRWEMSEAERQLFLEQGHIYLMVYTRGAPLQPFWLQVEPPLVAQTADQIPDGYDTRQPGVMSPERAKELNEQKQEVEALADAIESHDERPA